MRQDVLDRLVSEERARKVAEILFPEQAKATLPCEERDCVGLSKCEPCNRMERAWSEKIAEVRAAIQSTFTISADTPSQGN